MESIEGVHIIGNVDDIRPWYTKADVFVVPLRKGRGVQNKVLEAMAMGKAVVATSRANAGVAATDGAHLMIGDSATEFADAVKRLLQNDEKRIMLGENARRFVMEEFNWNVNMARFDDLLK